MEKPQLKKTFQKIKERSAEERQKIKKLVIRKKENFLTALTNNWRDVPLKPLTSVLWNFGITANKLSWFSILLLAVAIGMYFFDYSLPIQLVILLIVALIDGLDGPLARNNNNVTIHGIWIDHLRDIALVAWATYLIYQFNLLTLQTIVILWSLEIIFSWITIKDFLIRYLQELSGEEEQLLVNNFFVNNLQASWAGKSQFFFWATGYGFLLGSLVLTIPYAATIGQSFVILAIIFSALNISESYQKSI